MGHRERCPHEGMEDRVTDDDRITEQTIARYRAELTAEAELARGDLDEIEDHLRALYGELRDAGLPRAEAIAQACRRLGEPRALAREHARVRTPFGTRLSRTRAWSAAALLAPFAVEAVKAARHVGMASPYGIELLLVVLVLAALVARLTWARPVILGSLVMMLAWNAIVIAGTPVPFSLEVDGLCACGAGALAFLVPWRHGELAPAGIALALLAPAYMGGATALSFFLTAPGGILLANPLSVVAVAAVLAAGAGVVLRARWAAFAAALAALALAGTTSAFWPLEMRIPSMAVWRLLILGSMMLGSLSAAAAAVMCWRTARSRLGTLRHVLD